MSETYPSVISQEGSASRNVRPISTALSRLLPTSSSGAERQVRILEIGSGSYDHLRSFAQSFPHVRWTGTVRDQDELGDVQRRLEDHSSLPTNVDPPRILDIASEDDWADLRGVAEAEGPFGGVLMINILHCIPPSLPPSIFQHLSPLTPEGRALLHPPTSSSTSSSTLTGWIATYGPFLKDDGSYASTADAEFDSTHVRAVSPLLGLRSIATIDEVATRWGFSPGQRETMPKGNMWVVWRPASHPKDDEPSITKNKSVNA